MTGATLSDPMTVAAPFVSSEMRVLPEWIDYNGHLNMAYYNVLFDRSLDELFAVFGMGPAYLTSRHGSSMTAECHVRYLREIHEGDPVRVSNHVIASDAKRIHTFQELRHADEGWLSATSENMTLHIDMAIRKAAPFPSDIAATIGRFVEAHRAVPRPDALGRRIAMPA